MPVFASPDTARALGAGLKHCDSRSLWKDKFPFFDPALDESKRISLDLFMPRGREDIGTLRKQWQENIAKQERNRVEGKTVNEVELQKATTALAATALFSGSAPGTTPCPRRWLSSLPAERVLTFSLLTASRLAIGLANGVLENAGCTLHRLFGFPVISGSALKGIARDAAAALGKTEMELTRLFGGAPGDEENQWQGGVAFLDAHAVLRPGQADLELDIVTPHFQKYYGGTGNPNALDDESPVPSVFPVVCQGVVFEFALVSPTGSLNSEESSRLLGMAKECLVHALKFHGLGAKTAAGYGRFREAAARPLFKQDLFPPPAPPLLSPEEEVLAKWRGKPVNGFNVGRLIQDLLPLMDPVSLASVFDTVLPEEHRAKFRAANPFWTTFLLKGGKVILERINRQLPRQ